MPVLAMALILVTIERMLHIGIFDPALGGDPLLFQHLFWFYSHPAVYIMILPGMGVVSEVIPCFARKKLFGYTLVASVQHRHRRAGLSGVGPSHVRGRHFDYAAMVFSVLSYLVAVPSAIKVFNWTATLYKGSISFDTPMLYRLGFIALFTAGGLTGLVPGDAGHGHARARHLLRHRPLPLHHGGRHGHGATWAGCISGGRKSPGGCTRNAGRGWRR